MLGALEAAKGNAYVQRVNGTTSYSIPQPTAANTQSMMGELGVGGLNYEMFKGTNPVLQDNLKAFSDRIDLSHPENIAGAVSGIMEPLRIPF